MQIVERKFSPVEALGLVKGGVHPIMARLLVSRGVRTREEAAQSLDHLIPYTQLKGAVEMAEMLADYIEQNKRLLIIADYDADGATACSVGVRALRAFGANVGYLIPNRIEHGYGLTPAIVQIAAQCEPRPDYIITVDNGISSHAGIDEANRLGIPVLVTDHHLPGDTAPAAQVIVNPNQHGCTFPSKALAGVGVMYYVMWALQDELISRGINFPDPTFGVDKLLPIVAIGTVADVVALDANNRTLVSEGLYRIRQNNSIAGVDALAKFSGKNPRLLTSSDIAFGLGPRINAAGRLESMDAGVECLTTDLVSRAEALAKTLHEINDRRKEIEGEMTEEAIRRLLTDVKADRYSAVLHAKDWHQGVIGIVAGRIKERIWRPTFVMADGKDGEIKGSGRSIPGLHLRDALDMVNTRHPGVLSKFGGHAMAAGVTLNPGKLDEFIQAFEAVCRELLTPSALLQQVDVDGSLPTSEMTLDTVQVIKDQVWGQAFPEPSFCDEFSVVEARPIGSGQHLKLLLQKGGKNYQAVKFRHTDGLPPSKVKAVYKLDANSFKDEVNLQLLVEHLMPA